MGIFSLIDAILDTPMEKLLYALPISSEIRDTLLGKESQYQPIYKLVCAYERSNWDQVSSLAETLYMSEESIAKAYIEAVAWAQELTRASKRQTR
jgi:c-di-GMP-related signal transduction protein